MEYFEDNGVRIIIDERFEDKRITISDIIKKLIKAERENTYNT